jgi:hypothetical protein
MTTYEIDQEGGLWRVETDAKAKAWFASKTDAEAWMDAQDAQRGHEDIVQELRGIRKAIDTHALNVALWRLTIMLMLLAVVFGMIGCCETPGDYYERQTGYRPLSELECTCPHVEPVDYETTWQWVDRSGTTQTCTQTCIWDTPFRKWDSLKRCIQEVAIDTAEGVEYHYTLSVPRKREDGYLRLETVDGQTIRLFDYDGVRVLQKPLELLPLGDYARAQKELGDKLRHHRTSVCPYHIEALERDPYGETGDWLPKLRGGNQ